MRLRKKPWTYLDGESLRVAHPHLGVLVEPNAADELELAVLTTTSFRLAHQLDHRRHRSARASLLLVLVHRQTTGACKLCVGRRNKQQNWVTSSPKAYPDP